MLGALFGDINGSQYEFTGEKIYDFKLWGHRCRITDDSLMTLAVASAIFCCKDDLNNLDRFKTILCKTMREIAKDHPNTQWGQSFYNWLFVGGPATDSYGNGAGMRISPVGWVATSEEQVKVLSKAVTEVSHTHPEALKGAEAVAMCIYLARIGKDKDYIRNYVADNYYPKVRTQKYENIWQSYQLDETWGSHVTCQGSIPESIIAFLDSTDFEDAVRKAVQYGGDSDTQACMTGSIAEAYYGIPKFYDVEDKVLSYLSQDLITIYFAFDNIKLKRVDRN